MHEKTSEEHSYVLGPSQPFVNIYPSAYSISYNFFSVPFSPKTTWADRQTDKLETGWLYLCTIGTYLTDDRLWLTGWFGLAGWLAAAGSKLARIKKFAPRLILKDMAEYKDPHGDKFENVLCHSK